MKQVGVYSIYLKVRIIYIFCSVFPFANELKQMTNINSECSFLES